MSCQLPGSLHANLLDVKIVRIWFVVLLAALLPIRSAVAAAMLCPVSSSGMQSELRMHEHSAMHEATDHAMAHDHGAPHDHGSDSHDHAASDRCNVCSAFCSATPLVSDVPTLVTPPDLAAVVFAELAAPPPSFVSEGQERPPRTI